MSLFRVSADPHVNGLIEKCGYATAALTIIPIPGSEVIGVMPLHVGMVVGIAHLHGQNLTTETATELLIQIGTTVGASLLGSRVATTAAKFVLPGLGGIIAAPFMFASTLAIGAVADQWFNSGGTLSEIEMRALYERTVKSAKSSFQTDRMKDSGAMQQAREAVGRAKAGDSAAAPTGGTSSPAPSGSPDLVSRLRQGKEMLAAGLIDQAEFDALKARILSEM